jgi:hypothetical protein
MRCSTGEEGASGLSLEVTLGDALRGPKRGKTKPRERKWVARKVNDRRE